MRLIKLLLVNVCLCVCICVAESADSGTGAELRHRRDHQDHSGRLEEEEGGSEQEWASGKPISVGASATQNVSSSPGQTSTSTSATATATATATTAMSITMNQQRQELAMQFPLYMRILATIACAVILAVGVCGNLLVPLVVIKTKYLRNSTNLFLINLSVADLLVLIVCMPTVLIELHSRPETWLLGEPMCKLSNFVEMLAANGSIFTILAISFERYYAICKPLKAGYKCTRLRATLIICLVWLLASILTSPILIIAKSNETIYIDGSQVYNCILETDTYWPKMYAFVSLIAFFWLPLIVLMLVYWLIGRRLTRESIAMSSTTTTTTTATMSTANDAIACQRQRQPAKVKATQSAEIGGGGDEEQTGSRQTRRSQWRVKRAASLKFKSILSSLQPRNYAHYQSLREGGTAAGLTRFNQSKTPVSSLAGGKLGGGTDLVPINSAQSSRSSKRLANRANGQHDDHFLAVASGPATNLMEASEQALGKVAVGDSPVRPNGLSGLAVQVNGQQPESAASAGNNKITALEAANSLNCNEPDGFTPMQPASETSSSPSLKPGPDQPTPDKQAPELPMNLAAGIGHNDSDNKITPICSSIKDANNQMQQQGLLAKLVGQLIASFRGGGDYPRRMGQCINRQIHEVDDGGKFTRPASSMVAAVDLAGRQRNLAVSSGIDDSEHHLNRSPRSFRAVRCPEPNQDDQSGHQSPSARSTSHGDAAVTHSSTKTNDCASCAIDSQRAAKTAATLSRRSKFSLAKRFSISSSSASMQTNCTTLLSDGSSIGGGGRSYQQQQRSRRKSPRLPLHHQRSSLESQADCVGHDCGFKSAKMGSNGKKSANFNAVGTLINAHAHGAAKDIVSGGDPMRDVAYAIPTYYASSVSGNSSSTPYTSKSPSPDLMFTAEPSGGGSGSGDRQAPSSVQALLKFEAMNGGDKFDRCGEQKAKRFKVIESDEDDENSETDTHLIDTTAVAGTTSNAEFALNRNCDNMDLEHREQSCLPLERAPNGLKPTTCLSHKQQQQQAKQEHHFHLSLPSSNVGRNQRHGHQVYSSNNHGSCHHNHQGTTSELLVVQDISKKQQMDSRRQVVMMLAFVVACFFLLFFPYRVFTIWLILSTEDQVQSLGMETYYNLTYFSRILIYLHSAINPIAYNLISTKFRRAFMSILLCRGPSSRRHFTTEHHRMVYGNHRSKINKNSQQLQRSSRPTITTRQVGNTS